MDEGTGDARRAAEERVCEAVRVLSLAIDRYVTEVSRVLGVPARDVHAMGVVKGWPGASIGPRELGRELGVSAPATTALVTRMTGSGHAQRSEHGVDGRRVDVRLTPSGEDASRRCFAPLTEQMRSVLAELDDDTLAVVADVITRLREAAHRTSPAPMRTP